MTGSYTWKQLLQDRRWLLLDQGGACLRESAAAYPAPSALAWRVQRAAVLTRTPSSSASTAAGKSVARSMRVRLRAERAWIPGARNCSPEGDLGEVRARRSAGEQPGPVPSF